MVSYKVRTGALTRRGETGDIMFAADKSASRWLRDWCDMLVEETAGPQRKIFLACRYGDCSGVSSRTGT